jgi:hypothetical protein
MTVPRISSIAAIVLAFTLGAICTGLGSARAEPRPAIDRDLMERLVRSQESQIRAIESLVRATEKCHR